MNFLFKGNTYELPSGLTAIPVFQQQAWALAYGHALCLRGIELEKEWEIFGDTPTTRIRRAMLFMDEITQALSFYSGIPLAEIRKTIDISDITGLLAESQISMAIQNAHLNFPQYAVETPEDVAVAGFIFHLASPAASVDIEDLTHEEFMVYLQLAEYMLQLAEGNWNHFHLICAGFVRLAGEYISPELIEATGERGQIMRKMDMQDGMGLAQYFIGQLPQMLRILDKYTVNQLTAETNT